MSSRYLSPQHPTGRYSGMNTLNLDHHGDTYIERRFSTIDATAQVLASPHGCHHRYESRDHDAELLVAHGARQGVIHTAHALLMLNHHGTACTVDQSDNQQRR